ncbi:TonB-dependent receptor [Gemmatirosa kalamazoonensis]|uniref:TonB-dependent receptor n=1 Tax=Gemmatirosa kalamazoonensis TaxID=861299 RepID=W0RGP6_9BACT|nr:TonB-dependent receptor [Gemmatirosa kalamazoonensis]AHG88573.1 TonB-dependent receptor [Gemmatirosa kalamazoonensis]
MWTQSARVRHPALPARAALAALALAARAAAAQTGTVVGRVTDAATGAPVAAAQVTLTGTQRVTSVDADGRFRLTNVPAGAGELRARALGHTPASAAFSLVPNGIDTVALSMAASGVELDAVVVTGSLGDTRRRAVGHSVAVVDARAIVGASAVANLTEVLQAKAPGLTVFPPSGTVGTAAAFRLRGAGSLSASNNPTIYVDGVRVSTRDQGNYDVFGQATTALDAINPADIASVEVIKGPAASTLYGAEAAAGVIQIFTQRGRPGRVAWEARVDVGRSDWDTRLRPVNFAIATAERLADTVTWPGFEGKALGDVISFRPLSDGRALRTGGLSKVLLSASGGADRYTFYVSAGTSSEDGVFHNNAAERRSLRSNVTLAPSRAMTFTTDVALAKAHIRLPLNDDAGPLGLIFSSYLAAPGRAYTFPGGRDYSSITPEVADVYDNQTWADRLTVASTMDYAPTSWLANVIRVGLDANVGRAELYFAPDPLGRRPFVARGSLGLDNTKGLIAEGRPESQDVTLSYDATATRRWSRALVSHTSLGMQYLADVFRRTDAIGTDVGSGALRSVAAAAVTHGTASSSEQKSLGVYAQQQLSLADRLFVTLAARVDNNSAFGSRLKAVVYPKASVSYVVSDARHVTVPGVDALRLRAAWGQAGNAPRPFDAERSYTASVVTFANGTQSALHYASTGNPNLRPERGSEIEVGFESALLGDRVDVDVSYYDKTTRDALIGVPVPPSTGFADQLLTNLGEISNRGVEVLVRAVPVRRKSLTVDAALSLATNRNRLVSFGDGRAPVVFGFNAPSQRYQEGFPLGAMWAQRVRYNADGTLLKVGGRPVLDTASVYMGPSAPTRDLSLTGGALLLGRLRVRALADYKGGHYQFNVKDSRRDRDGVSWETVNPAADPDEVLARQFQFQTFLHIQRADFVKLRDVSIGYDVPLGGVHGAARRATLTLAGHNLKIWTRYGGADPEVNYSGAARFNRDDAWVVPQTRRYSATVAVAF